MRRELETQGNDRQERLNYFQHKAHEVLAVLRLTAREDIEILELAIRMRQRDLDDQVYSPEPSQQPLRLVR